MRRARWSATTRFRGVIGTMLTKSGWFRPVARDYRKQKQEFVLLHQSSSRSAGDVTFTFSPTIRLTCVSRYTDRTDFKFDTARIFQTLNVEGSGQQLVTGTDAVIREFSSAQRTKVRELLSSLFSTWGSTVREITRSRTHERISPAKAQRRKENPEVFLRAFAPLREKFSVATSRVLDRFTHISELKLFTNKVESSRTSNSHQITNFHQTGNSHQTTSSQQRHDRWLLLHSKNTKREVESPSTTNVFTTLSLNFASPNVSETELVHQQIARFVSSPELTYAKRQQAMSDGVVQALRDLRTPDPEPKRMAPPALPSIEQITSQVKMQLERELRIERERRGR